MRSIGAERPAPRRLTRRALLSRLGVAAGVLLIAARRAPQADAQPLGDGVTAHRLDLRPGPGLREAGARRHVARVALAVPACLVGLRWQGPLVPAELRARRTDGRWTAWFPLRPGEHVSDDPAGGRASDPIWVGAAEVLEVRASQRIPGLAACVVDAAPPTREEAQLREALSLPVAPNGVRPPAVIPRSEWTRGKLKPREEAEIGEVLAAIVHHTATADDYAPEDSAAIVRAICRFHRNVSKWSDIGYHLLVDRYGQVFEGRAGGLDRPLVGAHAYGANRTTVGIAMIGTWSASSPDDEGLAALVRAAAWKLSLHGCPVEGTVTLTDVDGTQRDIDRIAGHGDWNATRCPGRTLREGMPDLRTRAAALVVPPPQFDFAASAAQVRVGQSVTFSGRITHADGTPFQWQRVAIVRAAPRPATGLGFATTDGDGRFALQAPLRDGGRFEARLPDGTGISPRRQVLVEPRIRLAIERRPTEQGPGLHVRGWVRPHLPSVILDVHRRTPDGGWVRVLRWRVRLVRGTFDIQVPLRQAGRHRVRVIAAADGRIADLPPAQAIVRVPWSGA